MEHKWRSKTCGVRLWRVRIRWATQWAGGRLCFWILPCWSGPVSFLSVSRSPFLLALKMIRAWLRVLRLVLFWWTASSLLRSLGSVGLTLVYWPIGLFISLAGISVYLEFTAYFPSRSGAEVVYLEQAYRKPRFFFPVAFAVQTVILSFVSSNAIGTSYDSSHSFFGNKCWWVPIIKWWPNISSRWPIIPHPTGNLRVLVSLLLRSSSSVRLSSVPVILKYHINSSSFQLYSRFLKHQHLTPSL